MMSHLSTNAFIFLLIVLILLLFSICILFLLPLLFILFSRLPGIPSFMFSFLPRTFLPHLVPLFSLDLVSFPWSCFLVFFFIVSLLFFILLLMKFVSTSHILTYSSSLSFSFAASSSSSYRPLLLCSFQHVLLQHATPPKKTKTPFVILKKTGPGLANFTKMPFCRKI